MSSRRFRRGIIQLQSLDDDDVALIAHHGDKEAIARLWENAEPLAARIATNFGRKYWWIDSDDLSQSILLEFPKILKRYKPSIGTVFLKYLYFGFYRAAQDALRKEDPLGIQIPQKARYPDWMRLSEYGYDKTLFEIVVHDGIRRIDNREPFQASNE